MNQRLAGALGVAILIVLALGVFALLGGDGPDDITIGQSPSAGTSPTFGSPFVSPDASPDATPSTPQLSPTAGTSPAGSPSPVDTGVVDPTPQPSPSPTVPDEVAITGPVGIATVSWFGLVPMLAGLGGLRLLRRRH